MKEMQTIQPQVPDATVQVTVPNVGEEKKNSFKKIGNKFKDLLTKYEKLPQTKKILIAGGIIVFFLAFSGILAFAYIQLAASGRQLRLDDKLVGEAGGENGSEVVTPSPEEIRDQESPINGVLYTKSEMEEMKSRYPLAIIVENHVDARPQSGLIKADIVYEMLAEGGITRLVPIFWGNQVEEVGPNRSLRKYMIDVTSEYEAILKHIGWASDTLNADTDAQQYLYDTGEKSFMWGGYGWRSTDRVAPHNAYTRTDKLWEEASSNGWVPENLSLQSWKFKNDLDLEDRPETSVIEYSFSSSAGSYGVRWIYDKDSNMYSRENNGSASIDKVTGLQIESKVIIAQEVEMSYPSPRDDKNRIILDVIGEGNAKVFQDGDAIDATWKKNSRTSRTRFYDGDGNELSFSRGQVWVAWLPVKSGKLEGDLSYN